MDAVIGNQIKPENLCLRKRHKKAFKSKRKRRKDSQSYQTLEKRAMLNATPVAVADPQFFANQGSWLNISDIDEGLLANDFDAENNNLSVVTATEPSHGTLWFGSDGTFSYYPITSFSGVDSFTYRISDGVNLSKPATVQIKVGDGLSANQLADDVSNNSFLHDGDLSLNLPIGSGLSLNYQSDTIPTVLIPIETFITPGTELPGSITANLTVDGVSSGDVYFNTDNLATGEPLRFVLRTLNTQSDSGTYDWSADITLNSGSSSTTDTFSGKTNIVNRVDSEFGSGWWLNGLDQLHVQSDGVMLENGDGSSFWFANNGSGFKKADGDLSYSTLTQKSNGEFLITDKWNNTRTFDSSGKLLSSKRPNNIVSDFTYEYDSSDRIQKILDQFGREFNFFWSADGNLESVSDFAGRSSSFTITNGLLTSAIVADESQANYVAPEWQYGYTSIDGSQYLNRVTAPDDTQTNYVYQSDSRTIEEIVNADGESWSLHATATIGLGAATVLKVADVDAHYVDELGNEYRFSTDRFGNLTSYTTPLGNTSTSEYDTIGQLFRSTGEDPDGIGPGIAPVTSFGYDSIGNVVTIVNADGTTSTSTWEPNFNGLASSTNELGNTEFWTYDSKGNVESYTDAEGNEWTYTYDAYGNLLTEISPAVSDGISSSVSDQGGIITNDPDGHFENNPESIVTTYVYEDTIYNRLNRIVFDDGSTQEFTYTSSDQLATFTDELGRTTSYAYDPLDRVTQTTLPSPGSSTESPVYSWQYGDNLLVAHETDPLGNVTSYTYDVLDRLEKLTLPDPDGSGPLSRPEYTYEYDESGRLISETDPTFGTGVSVSYAYDADGRLTSVDGPTVGQTTTYAYDDLDRLIREIDPSGRNITFQYNVNNELTSVTDHDGSTVSYLYDDAGQLIAQTDQINRTTTYDYFKTGWLKTTTLPDPDGGGVADAPVYENVYDPLGRLAKQIDPLDRDEVYIYDTRHRIIEHIHQDPDRELNENGPLLPASTWYTYDAAGRLTETEDVLNRITQYDYDDLDRLTQLTLPDPDRDDGPQESPIESYSYDIVGNLTSSIDARGNETKIQYDNLYRQTVVTLPDPDGNAILQSPVWTLNYGDDTQLQSVTDPLGRVATRGYDDAGRAVSFTDALGNETTYQYDELNRVQSVTTPDPDGPLGNQEASVTSYEYDIRSRLTKTTDAAQGETTRVYDAANQLLQLTDAENNSTRWAYDNLGRVALETKDTLRDESHYKHDTRSYHQNLSGRTIREVDRLGRSIEYGKEGTALSETWFEAGYATTWTETPVEGGASNEVQRVYLASEIGYEDPGVDNPPGTCHETPDGSIYCTSGVPDVPPSGQVTTGWFRLAFEGQVTEPIPNNATPAELEAALEALESVDDVHVERPEIQEGSFLTRYYTHRPFVITFQGEHAGEDVPEIMTDVFAANVGDAVRTLNFEYDRAARLVKAYDPAATYNFEYDDLDRITSKTEEINGLDVPVDFDFTYNAIGQRTSLAASIGDSADYVNTYEYDNLNRLIAIQQSDTAVPGGPLARSTDNLVADKRVAFSYNALGQTTYINRFEGTTNSGPAMRTVFNYDAGNRVELAQHRQVQGVSQSTAIQTYDYEYDNLGRFTSIDSTLDGLSEFNYDSLHQLTDADHAVQRPDESYSYDLVGNRVFNAGRSDSGSDGTVPFGTVADGGAGIDSITPGPDSVTSYDAEGNRLIDDGSIYDQGEQSYWWDHRNRLVAYQSTADELPTSVTYEYDVFNRLVRRTAAEFVWVPPGGNDSGDSGGSNGGYPGGGNSGGNGNSGGSDDGIPGGDGVSGGGDGLPDGNDGLPGGSDDGLPGGDGLPGDSDGGIPGGNGLPGGDDGLPGGGGSPGGDGIPGGDDGLPGGDAGSTGGDDGSLDDDVFDGNEGDDAPDIPIDPSIDCQLDLHGYLICSSPGKSTGAPAAFTARNSGDDSSSDATSGSVGYWQQVVTDTFFAGFDGKTATLEFEQVDGGDIELVQRNLWRGDQLLAIEEVESTDTPGEVLWALSDHLGTVRDIAATNDSGQFEIVNHRVFDSFGVITSETNPEVEFEYGFTGRWTDSITGLTHHLNRWYSPGQGKWLSEDPIGFAAGDVNVHRYVGNSVNNFIDLDGLKAAGPIPQEVLVNDDPLPPEAYDRARETLGPEFFENYKRIREAHEADRFGYWAWYRKRQLAMLDKDFEDEAYLQSKVMQIEENPLGVLADNTHPLNMHNIIAGAGPGAVAAPRGKGGGGGRKPSANRPVKRSPTPLKPVTESAPAEPRSAPPVILDWQWKPTTKPIKPRHGNTAPHGDVPALIGHVDRLRTNGFSPTAIETAWVVGMNKVNERAGQFGGIVENNFYGTARGGWRVYVGRPAIKGGDVFALAINENTGDVATGKKSGITRLDNGELVLVGWKKRK